MGLDRKGIYEISVQNEGVGTTIKLTSQYPHDFCDWDVLIAEICKLACSTSEF